MLFGEEEEYVLVHKNLEVNDLWLELELVFLVRDGDLDHFVAYEGMHWNEILEEFDGVEG
jgi:hypothetical protein